MNSEFPLLSIIIPCFNDFKYIKTAIDSANNQSYSNTEIIVIDDGSDQRTKAILKTLEPEIDLLITQENRGPSAARNAGIRIAKGEYILVLDSDDYFDSYFCEKAINIFLSNNKVIIVTCYARWFEENGRFKIFKPRGGKITDLLFTNIAMGSVMFIKEHWKRVNGYDEQLIKGYEDWEFYIRLHKDGGETYVIPEVLFNYRNKDNSRNSIAKKHKYNLLKYIYIKHVDIYTEHFETFITKWLDVSEKNEHFKQQVMDSLEYKIGYNLLKPFKYFGFLKKKSSKNISS